jgi:UDP-2-acetamido-2-deoxy-ribo-hexuluronate aminotransferase
VEFIDLKTQYRLLQGSIEQRIQAVLNHGQYIMGPEVMELEERLASYVGTKHCITVASGTEALLASLMAIDIQPGDEVITSPFSFIATAEVIVRLGAKPVFVDIEDDTCNINAELIEASITPRTRAIIPVSLYGQTADMDKINAIAEKYGLLVIEDAAQSFGALYKGKRSCNLSTIGCTSFFPSKPLGCYGDGGAIFTNDNTLAQVLREMRIHGQSARYVHSRIGLGARMDTLQCAIVLAKLDRFEFELEQRAKIGAHYHKLLNGKIRSITLRSDRQSTYAQFTVLVENREYIREKLAEKNIPTAVHYPIAMSHQKPYGKFVEKVSISNACYAADHVMSLPMHPELTELDQQRVVNNLIEISEKALRYCENKLANSLQLS